MPNLDEEEFTVFVPQIYNVVAGISVAIADAPTAEQTLIAGHTHEMLDDLMQEMWSKFMKAKSIK